MVSRSRIIIIKKKISRAYTACTRQFYNFVNFENKIIRYCDSTQDKFYKTAVSLLYIRQKCKQDTVYETE